MFFNFLITFVQLIAETMPISSSGHVQLANSYYDQYKNSYTNASLRLPAWWIDCIHMPTVLLLLFFLWNRYQELFKELTSKKLIDYFLIIIIADLITTMSYFFIVPFLPKIPLYVGFMITSLILLLTSYNFEGFLQLPTLMKGILFGIAQTISLIPGISRFATLFLMAKILGYNSYYAFFLTWIIGLPLVLAAATKACIYNSSALIGIFQLPLLIVITTATLMSAVTLYISYVAAITEHLFIFGFYMILPIIFSIILR